MNDYNDQLDYAREQARIWARLPLEERADQMDAHLESEFGPPLPGVVGDALFMEHML